MDFLGMIYDLKDAQWLPGGLIIFHTIYLCPTCTFATRSLGLAFGAFLIFLYPLPNVATYFLNENRDVSTTLLEPLQVGDIVDRPLQEILFSSFFFF